MGVLETPGKAAVDLLAWREGPGELQGMARRLSVEAGNAVSTAGPLLGRTSPCGRATEVLVMLTSVGSWGHRKDCLKLG